MILDRIMFARIIFSLTFCINIMAMDEENRFEPQYFRVSTNADLLKRFPITKNRLYAYPQPDIQNYQPHSVDPELYRKAISNVLTLNYAILQPDEQNDFPPIPENSSAEALKKHTERINEINTQAASQELLRQHIMEVTTSRAINIDTLNRLNQIPY